MDGSIRKAALRAAAKTAIIVSLSGCYGSHGRPARAVGADAGPLFADAGAALVIDAGPGPVPDAGELACGSLLGSLAITNPEPPGEGWAWGAHFADEGARLEPEVGGCCMELEAAAAAGEPVVAMGSPLAMACCDVITAAQNLAPFSNLGCTPWGPPCPPEMAEDEETLLA